MQKEDDVSLLALIGPMHIGGVPSFKGDVAHYRLPEPDNSLVNDFPPRHIRANAYSNCHEAEKERPPSRWLKRPTDRPTDTPTDTPTGIQRTQVNGSHERPAARVITLWSEGLMSTILLFCVLPEPASTLFS